MREPGEHAEAIWLGSSSVGPRQQQLALGGAPDRSGVGDVAVPAQPAWIADVGTEQSVGDVPAARVDKGERRPLVGGGEARVDLHLRLQQLRRKGHLRLHALR